MKRRRLARALWTTLAILVACFYLFPVFWILVSSFKGDAEIFQYPPTILPAHWNFESYYAGLGEYSIVRGFMNSLTISVPSCLLSVALGVPAAFGLARYRPRGDKAFLLMFLVAQMLPISVVLTPLFILFRRLGMLNTFVAPIVSTATTLSVPFITLTLRPYFRQLPTELEQAAFLDGLGRWSTFLRIFVPISAPGIVLAITFSFIFAWNDLIFALTFLGNQRNRPLTAGIYNFITQYGISWNKVMAFGTIIILPVIVLFVVLQRQIVSGLTAGALKE
jgi:multiple sugar transport system permease protein